MSDILLTTTPSVEGKAIKEYLGVVVGRGYDAGHGYAIEDALEDIRRLATELDADAVVGIRFSMPNREDAVVVGTAVKFK